MTEDLRDYGDAIDDVNSHRPDVVGRPGTDDVFDLFDVARYPRRHYAHCAKCGVWVADPRPKPGEDPEKVYCRSENCYPEKKSDA